MNAYFLFLACPGCNTGIRAGDTAATAHVLAGFSWSVVFLIAAVGCALSMLGLAAARAVKETEHSPE